jgi:hypothetical protein
VERTPLVDRPWLKTFLGIAGFAIAGAGLLVALWVNFVRPQAATDGRSDESSGVTTSGGATASERQSDSSDPAVVGKCFTAAWIPTGCDAVHHWEAIAVGGACGPAELLVYLGGVPGIDVLRSDANPEVHTVDGRNACFIGAPGGGPVEGSVRDALASPRGDVWRRCIDDRVAREVHCAEPHTAEVIGPPVSGELNCLAQADAYAETSVARFGLHLSVTAKGSEGAQQCVVEVRGDNVLVRSLRNLSAGALPIEPD